MFDAELNELAHLDETHDKDARERLRDAVHARLQESARLDPVGTASWIRGLDLSKSTDAEWAAELIEALSPVGDAHASVFVGLFDRALELTEQRGCRVIPSPVFQSLGFLESHEPEAVVFKHLKPRYLRMTRAAQPCLRAAAVDLLGHFIESAEVKGLVLELLAESHWRVRYEAEMVLKYENALPNGYSVPLWDRLIRLCHLLPMTA